MAANDSATENTLEPARTRKTPSAQDPAQPSGTRRRSVARKKTDAREIPEEVRRRFIQVKDTYHFPDGAPAFRDWGSKLTTSSENTEVIGSLIVIAQARGWDSVEVRGTERFRRDAWYAARRAGLEVQGFEPNEFERERLARSLAREIASGTKTPQAEIESPLAQTGASKARGGLLTGRLIEHGRAPYQHKPKEPMSYFVRLETAAGERVIWGVDLERAFRESLTKPNQGDEISLRTVRQEPVTVKTSERAQNGASTGERELETYRNRWIVEKRNFFEARAEAERIVRDASIDPKRAVRQHPELVGTYLQIHAAELAAKQFQDPQDREFFVRTVRAALADAVGRGEPLPAVRLRERTPGRSPKSREREPAPARG